MSWNARQRLSHPVFTSIVYKKRMSYLTFKEQFRLETFELKVP